MVVEVDRGRRTLTASDRCDRCSARAMVETVMLGSGALLWCSHHYEAFSEALTSFGAEVVCDLRG